LEEGGRMGVGGAIAGAALGGIGGIGASSGMYIDNNKRFISESPYVGKRRYQDRDLRTVVVSMQVEHKIPP